MTLSGSRVTMQIDKNSGVLTSWIDLGQEFIAGNRPVDLFTLSMRSIFSGSQLLIPSSSAAEVTSSPGGKSRNGSQSLRLEFSGLPGSSSAAVQLKMEDGRIAWGIEVEIPEHYYLEWVDFPALVLPDTLKKSGGSGQLFWPAQEGVLIDDLHQRDRSFIQYREPSYPAHGWSGYYPSSCQMQFMAFMQEEAGLYIGCHDSEHYVKFLEYCPTESGDVGIQLRLFPAAAEGHWCLPYEIVFQSFRGDWHDAAEIYRNWVRSTPAMQHDPAESGVKMPEWVEKGTVVVCYPVKGQGDDKGDMGFNEYYPYTNIVAAAEKLSEQFDAPIMPLAMHWEGTAPWAPPFVWPPAGSEKNFREMIGQLHAAGHYFGVYCSGIGWTQQSMIDKNYSCRERFLSEHIDRKVCRGPKNEMYSLVCNGDDAQRWGFDLCAAAEGVADMAADEILKVAQSGCDYIQFFDQNLGGLTYLCYASDHNHPQSPGNWEVPAMKELMQQVRQRLDEQNLHPVIGCEAAAAEPLIGLFRFNDLRYNINFLAGKPVPAYNYVYHEYVCNFSGNQNPSAGIIDVSKSPENLLLRTAMGFIAGDTITVTLRDGGEIHWNWGSSWSESAPDQKSIVTLVRNMNRWRQGQWKHFLLFGTMRKPMPVLCETVPLVLGLLDAVQDYPAVLTSRWEYRGQQVQFFVNYRPVETEATIVLRDEEQYLLHSHASPEGRPITSGVLVLPPLQVIMLEIMDRGSLHERK